MGFLVISLFNLQFFSILLCENHKGQNLSHKSLPILGGQNIRIRKTGILHNPLVQGHMEYVANHWSSVRIWLPGIQKYEGRLMQQGLSQPCSGIHLPSVLRGFCELLCSKNSTVTLLGSGWFPALSIPSWAAHLFCSTFVVEKCLLYTLFQSHLDVLLLVSATKELRNDWNVDQKWDTVVWKGAQCKKQHLCFLKGSLHPSFSKELTFLLERLNIQRGLAFEFALFLHFCVGSHQMNPQPNPYCLFSVIFVTDII